MKLINGERWAKNRAKGRWRFVLVRGALAWGGAMAVLNAGLWYWQLDRLASIGAVSREDALAIWRRGTLLSTPLWIVVGAACFLGIWHLSEYLFRRAAGASRGDTASGNA